MTTHEYHKRNELPLGVVVLGIPLLAVLVAALAVQVDSWLTPVCGLVYP